MAQEQSTLRFGVCGIGLMGRGYFRIIRDNPAAAVTAVCDTDESRLRPEWYNAGNQGHAAASDDDAILQLGGNAYDGRQRVAEAFTDYRQMVASPLIDAVAVTTPSCLHADIAVAALEHGKHVICEKPMALTLEDCDRMIDAAEASGKTLIVDQCVRFFPQYELIKRYVDEGLIGRVRYAVLRRLSSPPVHSKDNWLLDGKQSGGALFDLHIHDVDFAHYLLGAPDAVLATGADALSGGIDHVSATYAYADGRYALLEGAWSLHAPWPFDMTVTVHGETGTLEWSAARGPNVHYFRGGERVEEIACVDGGGTRWLVNYFIDCVRRGRPVTRCTPESSRKSVELAALELRSIEEGAIMDVALDLSTRVA